MELQHKEGDMNSVAQAANAGQAAAPTTCNLQEPELWLLVRVGMLVGGLGYWHPACIGIHEKLLDSEGLLPWTLEEMGRLYRLPPDTARAMGLSLTRRKELKDRLTELRVMWDLGVATSPAVHEEVMHRREEITYYFVQPRIIEQTWEALLRVYEDEIWQFVIPYQDLCDQWGIEDQLGADWRAMRATVQDYRPKTYV
jgi:hypothetical protein